MVDKVVGRQSAGQNHVVLGQAAEPGAVQRRGQQRTPLLRSVPARPVTVLVEVAGDDHRSVRCQLGPFHSKPLDLGVVLVPHPRHPLRALVVGVRDDAAEDGQLTCRRGDDAGHRSPRPWLQIGRFDGPPRPDADRSFVLRVVTRRPWRAVESTEPLAGRDVGPRLGQHPDVGVHPGHRLTLCRQLSP